MGFVVSRTSATTLRRVAEAKIEAQELCSHIGDISQRSIVAFEYEDEEVFVNKITSTLALAMLLCCLQVLVSTETE